MYRCISSKNYSYVEKTNLISKICHVTCIQHLTFDYYLEVVFLKHLLQLVNTI